MYTITTMETYMNKLPPQEPLGEPFGKILYDNTWDLYEGSPSSFASRVYNALHRWVANGAATLALIALLSPKVAATSVTPWFGFLLMNVIYMYDGFKNKNWGWFSLCLFGGFWDILLIISRTTQLNVFWIFEPLVALLEKLP